MTAKSYPVQRHVPVTVNMEVPPPPPRAGVPSYITNLSDKQKETKTKTLRIQGGGGGGLPPKNVFRSQGGFDPPTPLRTRLIAMDANMTDKHCHPNAIMQFTNSVKKQMILTPGGGGGALDFHLGRGGVPLGVENLTLSQTTRRAKNTPCPNYTLLLKTFIKIMHTLY